MKCFFLTCCLLVLISFPAHSEPTSEELKLHDLINQYRIENGLKAIPWSPSLSLVAQVHAIDLNHNPPSKKCNMHSWSYGQEWSGCCYKSNRTVPQCMWNKPRELTSYTGNGYENGYGGAKGFIASAELAFSAWKKSRGHNSVILNKGAWKNHHWQALGVGIYKNHALIWLGEEKDPAP